VKERQTFYIDVEDARFLKRASATCALAIKDKHDMTPYIAYMAECWRQIGWQYGFEHTSVKSIDEKQWNVVSALGDVFWLNPETKVYEIQDS
jgi:hypothetical protein